MSDVFQDSFTREVDPKTVVPSTQSSGNSVSTRRNSSIPVNARKCRFYKNPSGQTQFNMKLRLVQQNQLSQSMIDRQQQAASNAQGNVQYVQSTVNLRQPALLTNPVQSKTAFVQQQLSQSMIDRQPQVPSNAQGNVQYVQSTVNLRQPALLTNPVQYETAFVHNSLVNL